MPVVTSCLRMVGSWKAGSSPLKPYFRPKSAGISPHSWVSHFRIGVE